MPSYWMKACAWASALWHLGESPGAGHLQPCISPIWQAWLRAWRQSPAAFGPLGYLQGPAHSGTRRLARDLIARGQSAGVPCFWLEPQRPWAGVTTSKRVPRPAGLPAASDPSAPLYRAWPPDDRGAQVMLEGILQGPQASCVVWVLTGPGLPPGCAASWQRWARRARAAHICVLVVASPMPRAFCAPGPLWRLQNSPDGAGWPEAYG